MLCAGIAYKRAGKYARPCSFIFRYCLLTNRYPVELELFLCCFHHDIHMIAADTGKIIHPASSCFALLPIHATSLPVLHVYLYEASQ